MKTLVKHGKIVKNIFNFKVKNLKYVFLRCSNVVRVYLLFVPCALLFNCKIYTMQCDFHTLKVEESI